MSSLNNTPFRVEITLGSPVATQVDPLYLDALLGAVNHGEHHLSLTVGTPQGSRFFLYEHGFDIDYFRQEDRVMKTGFSRRVESGLAMREKHCSDGLLQINRCIGSGGHTEISSASGQLKNYGGEGSFVTSQWYEKAVAWGVGDMDKVRDLLETVTHFGPKGKMGFGVILSVKVVADPFALEAWQYRVLPTLIKPIRPKDYAPVISPITGPYWDKSTQVEAQFFIGKRPELAAVS